jgi:hypothetical protein
MAEILFLTHRTPHEKSTNFRRTTSHIDTTPQAVVAHARDLEAGDSILPYSYVKAQFIYASEEVMTVTTDSSAFFVPPLFAVWMPAGVVHSILAHGA